MGPGSSQAARRQISNIAPRFGPEALVVSGPSTHRPRGDVLLKSNPVAGRLLRRLAYQLVPAALVTTAGVVLLSNLAKAPDMGTETRPVEAAINGEAIFKVTPREPAEVQAEDKPGKAAASRPAAKPKPAAAPVPAQQGRQTASLPAPLPIVPAPEQPPATAAPEPDNTVMGKLRSATATVQQIPQRAARSVAGWFSESAPPRPPAEVPARDFRASM
jgi:hypothetical protein